jgi:hypothetical protein
MIAYRQLKKNEANISTILTIPSLSLTIFWVQPTRNTAEIIQKKLTEQSKGLYFKTQQIKSDFSEQI